MKLSGTLADNLNAALTSARRLHDRPVHQDTIAFWNELVSFARARGPRAGDGRADIETLVEQLEAELAAR